MQPNVAEGCPEDIPTATLGSHQPRGSLGSIKQICIELWVPDSVDGPIVSEVASFVLVCNGIASAEGIEVKVRIHTTMVWG